MEMEVLLPTQTLKLICSNPIAPVSEWACRTLLDKGWPICFNDTECSIHAVGCAHGTVCGNEEKEVTPAYMKFHVIHSSPTGHELQA